MMKRIPLLILILFFVSSLNIRAERYYYFDHMTTSDGLSSNTIYCTMQDSNGFMWIGDNICPSIQELQKVATKEVESVAEEFAKNSIKESITDNGTGE